MAQVVHAGRLFHKQLVTVRVLRIASYCILAFVCLNLLGGCKSKKPKAAGNGNAEVETEDEDLSAEDKKMMAAAKPFLQAIAGNKFETAYEHLSTHAKKRMFDYQFSIGDDENPRRKPTEFKDVSAEKFAELLQQFAKPFGRPARIQHYYVSTRDPNELSGVAKSNLEKFDQMINIGNMPADIPASIRKAALRAQIGTEVEKKKRKRKQEDDEETDDGEGPYFNLKFVLVEEEGKLKVGYFEFFGPTMLD